MQLLLEDPNGGVYRPARLSFNLLQAPPDRPRGAHELCPTAHLDADIIAKLPNSQYVDTVTGLIATDDTGWMIVSMRADTVAIIIALDLGDRVVQRWLRDAPKEGPIVGLWSPTIARAVRLPVTEVFQELRRHAVGVRPAGRRDREELLGRLLDCIEQGELPAGAQSDARRGVHTHLAVQLGPAGGEAATGLATELLH